MAPLSLAAARWLAPASLAANVAAQTYGILSTPSMKDVHDANLAFFSPQPALVAAFFLPQQLVSLAWLRLLWKAKTPGGGDNEAQDRDTATMLAYAPFFIFGNLCIASMSLSPFTLSI